MYMKLHMFWLPHSNPMHSSRISYYKTMMVALLSALLVFILTHSKLDIRPVVQKEFSKSKGIRTHEQR